MRRKQTKSNQKLCHFGITEGYLKTKSNNYAEIIQNVRGVTNVCIYTTVLGACAILRQDARNKVVRINTRKIKVKNEPKMK
jgi:hypothetical protein